VSFTQEDKARKDRARARNAISKQPNVLGQMLAQAYTADGKRKQGMRCVVAKMDKKKSYLGTSLLKTLVGQGFVRPAGDGYAITQKGLTEMSRVCPSQPKVAQ